MSFLEVSSPRFKTGFFGGKFLPFHTGHLNCILRAASQCERLFVVLMHHGPEELAFLESREREGDAGAFPARFLTECVRELALRRELVLFENIEVLSYDCRAADERAVAEGRHPWFYECRDMVELIGRFDAAFSSEPTYAEAFRRFYPWAEAVLLDEQRIEQPVSGTELRTLPLSRVYGRLPRSYQVLVNRSVLVTGTESCGKTTLVRKLAALFSTSFTEEHGRLVSEGYGVESPGIEFYNGFLFGQKARESAACERAHRVYFCDTDAVVTDFYARRYEGSALPLAREIVAECRYDLVLYVEPTVPWVDDGWRSFGDPDQRREGDALLKRLYAEAGVSYRVLSGDYEQNYQQAAMLVRALLDE